MSADEQQQCARLFDWLERLLERYGGDFLFGTVSLADFALAPTVVRLTRHQVDLTNWPRSSAWARALLQHDHVSAWLAEADQLPPIWFDDYLAAGQEAQLRPDPRGEAACLAAA